MRATRFRIAVSVAATLLTGSAFGGDKEDIEAIITKLEQAANSGDIAGLAAMYAEGAALLPPGSPVVQGKENIQSYWKHMLDTGISKLDMTPAEIVVSGNHASEFGTFSYAAGNTPGTGKYVVLWLKGDDGTWRIRRDIWNDDAMPQ